MNYINFSNDTVSHVSETVRRPPRHRVLSNSRRFSSTSDVDPSSLDDPFVLDNLLFVGSPLSSTDLFDLVWFLLDQSRLSSSFDSSCLTFLLLYLLVEVLDWAPEVWVTSGLSLKTFTFLSLVFNPTPDTYRLEPDLWDMM